MNEYHQEFIQNLKEYRLQKNFSQAKLSELCNVAAGTIGNIECGLSKPSDLILKLASTLDVHPAMLFSKNAAKKHAIDSDTKEALCILKHQIEILLEK